jgi:predicted RNA-binding protein with TRAM domain
MSDCPLADDCPSYTEQIEGMGCTHYGDRGGAEWCNHYSQPISELKSAPVQPGEEVVVTVEDIHESGAGVGRTEDGFIVMVDGVLPPARARVRVVRVHGNHAKGEEVERLELDPDGEDDEEGDADEADADADEEADDADDEEASSGRGPDRERLGSRDNFWGS